MPYRNVCSRIALVTAVAFGLSACGGGGATVRPPVINTPPPPPKAETPDPDLVASFKTDEFNRTWALDAIGAADAYALGYTGKDALIAVIDFNFDLATDELNLHSGSRSADPVNVAIYEAQIGEEREVSPHGMAVAVTAAGVKNDNGIHGVAFDATVIAVDYFSGVNSRQVMQNGVLYTVSDPWTYAFNLGARIFNKSFGYDEDDIIENPPIVSQRYVIEFDTTAVELGGLVVSSAGNNADPEPSLSNLDALERLQALGLLDSGPGAYIIAGSVDEDLTLSSFSDAAGNGPARFYYLVAPGGQVTFPWTDGLAVGSGTSFAAPTISGAAAVILGRWPTLTAREVADIMFDTATDLGAAGVDEIYGNGLLNLSAAMQPVGQAKLAVAGAPSKAVTAAAIDLGAAFGDASSLRSALSNVMILDDYNRDFSLDANTLVTSRGGRLNIEARFDARRNWQSAALGLTGVGQLNYSLSRDIRTVPAFALAGQAEDDFSPQIDAVFEFTGQYADKKYYIGTGRSLSSALAREPYVSAASDGVSLTGANDTPLPTGRGIYFAVNNALSENTDVWFGVSQSRTQGYEFHPVEALQNDTDITAVAMRLDHYVGSSRFSAEFGASLETGSLLGSRSAGGLAVAGGATNNWISLTGGWQLADSIFLESKATLAVTAPHNVGGSILGDLGLITSSAVQIKASWQNAFAPDDSFTLMVHQPLRVENASATLTTGVGLDQNASVEFTNYRVSLAPAGREIALETSYRRNWQGWYLEANAAYRLDAGHFAGQKDAMFAFNISRLF